MYKTLGYGGSSFLGSTMLAATGGQYTIDVFLELRWMYLAVVLFVLLDLWYGVSEARYHGKEVRFSRACRRTANKIVDNMGYLLLGATIGLGLESLGIADHEACAVIGLLFGATIEVASIIGHVCVLHGIEVHVDWKKLIVSIIKQKNKTIGEAIDTSVENK